MTAEVVVRNKAAIALAADSAVTVTNANGQKSRHNADKLFQLSETEPVGIMVFNNANFMGYPVETIIKNFRRSEFCSPKDTLAEYAEAFFQYLEQLSISNKVTEIHILSFILDDINEMISTAFFQSLTKSIKSKKFENFEADFAYELHGFIDFYINKIDIEENDSLFQNFNQDNIGKNTEQLIVEEIINILNTQTSNISHYTFEENYLGATFGSFLSKLIKLLVLKIQKNIDSQNFTGFAFAGFGIKEDFPTLLVYHTHGIINGKLKKRIIKNQSIEAFEVTNKIVTLAQSNIANRYVHGLDPKLYNKVYSEIPNLLINFSKQIFSQFNQQKDLETEKENILVEMANKASEAFINEYINSFMSVEKNEISNSIGSMSKNDLAQFAEALVEMTALRGRVSMDIESVGGPVDVAVISKGDGFVWIKRKHYFDANLNPRYSALKAQKFIRREKK